MDRADLVVAKTLALQYRGLECYSGMLGQIELSEQWLVAHTILRTIALVTSLSVTPSRLRR